MPKDHDSAVIERLDRIVSLLQHMLALQLAEKGVPHQVIGKRIRAAKASVGEMLKGVERT